MISTIKSEPRDRAGSRAGLTATQQPDPSVWPASQLCLCYARQNWHILHVHPGAQCERKPPPTRRTCPVVPRDEP